MSALAHALRAQDEAAFARTLDTLIGVCRRDRDDGVRDLAEALLITLRECSSDAAISRLIQIEVPDAQTRLGHVLALTNEAAHRTLGHIEDCMPLAARIRDGAARAQQLAVDDSLVEFIEQTRRDAESISGHLTEVLLAQSFQDLTGQIIKRLIAFIGDVERALEILRRLSDARNAEELPRQLLEQFRASREMHDVNGFGPRIPRGGDDGIANDPQDVDQLIRELGI